MWKAVIDGVRLEETFTSEFRAQTAAAEAYTESLQKTPHGAVKLARLRGKTISWSEISPHCQIEVIKGEWVKQEDPDYHPEDNYEDPGSVLFIDRKKSIVRLGCYLDGTFIDENTKREFDFQEVSEYFIIPEPYYSK